MTRNKDVSKSNLTIVLEIIDDLLEQSEWDLEQVPEYRLKHVIYKMTAALDSKQERIKQQRESQRKAYMSIPPIESYVTDKAYIRESAY